MKTILVDFDDVLSNLIETCLDEFNRKFGYKLLPEDVTDWEMANVPHFAKYFHEEIKWGGIYRRATPNGAMLDWLYRVTQDHRVLIVTAHPAHCQRGLTHKFEWLDKYAPWLKPEQVIVCQDKRLVAGDILIDDREETCKRFWEVGRKAVLYPRPWNSQRSGDPLAVLEWLTSWAAEPGTVTPSVPEKTAGLRFDQGKPDTSLLQWPALLEVAKVSTFGAKKYARHNWLKGMPWSKVSAPLTRHLIKFEMGQDFDLNEKGEADDNHSGLYHTAHIAWNALALLTYQILGIGEDDRAKEYRDRTSNKE